MRNWYNEGVKAGKTDGWMNLEETLEETLDQHPSFARDQIELVQTDMDGWEETDHFGILYGSKMADDARDDETLELDVDAYMDNKTAFWEGYLEGRASIGKDIYKLARKLIAKRQKKVGAVSKKKSKSKSKSRQGTLGLQGLR